MLGLQREGCPDCFGARRMYLACMDFVGQALLRTLASPGMIGSLGSCGRSTLCLLVVEGCQSQIGKEGSRK